MSRERNKGTKYETQTKRLFSGQWEKLPQAIWHKHWDLLENGLVHHAIADGIWPELAEKEGRTGSSAYEKGDLKPEATEPFAVECKHDKSFQLSSWVDQSVKTALRLDGFRIPIVVHNRKGRNCLEDYVTMPAWAFMTHQMYVSEIIRNMK